MTTGFLHYTSLCRCSADGSADAVGGGAVAGRKAVDFENLAFAQGNHLMTNKKCDLPQKSYRAAHKASDSIKSAVCMQAKLKRFIRSLVTCICSIAPADSHM